MVVRCHPELKQLILRNVRNLKGKKNGKDQFYYVNKQLPEALMEKEREIRHYIKELKQKEESLPKDKKTKIEVRNGQLKKVELPMVLQLFPDDKEKSAIDKIKLVQSNSHSERGTQIISQAVSAKNLTEVRRAYVKSQDDISPC